MSTINKKPYINTVLESLTPEEKATLKSLINGEGDAPVFRSILPYGSPKLTASDKGIKRVDLEVSTLLASNVYRGYLIYNDSLCVLIVYYSFKNQGLKLIKLELGNDGFWEYNLKPCELGIVELRSELDDAGDIDPVDLTHYAKIHNYEEGIVLTEAILADVKSGDIIKMANLEFVVNNKVNQTPRSITGKCIGQIIGDSITIYELDWEIGEELEPITKKLDVSDEFDRDVTIQVATSGDSTFGDAITYEEWAEASKEKEYEVGTIIKFNNLNKGKSYRLIATDLTHGEGTKWELYDIVAPNVQPILPFDALDYGEGGPAGLQSFLDGDDTYIYPSNKHGYQSAQGFKQTLDAFFAGFPYKLKRDIRLTEIGTYIPRNEVSDNWGDFGDQSTKIYVESEGEDGLKWFKCYAKLYLSSAQEVGNEANPGTDSTNFPSRIELVEWDEDQQEYVGTGEYVYPEGEKDDYYDYGNGTEARAKRVKYFNGQPYSYWLRSPYLSDSYSWGCVNDYGNVDNYSTDSYRGVAPAFRV